MSEQPQSRQPSGVPTGGQFASSQRGEAGVSLNIKKASLLWPRICDTADDVFDFYSTVDIEDDVLARTERVYGELAEVVDRDWPAVATQYEAYSFDYDFPKPDNGDQEATAAWVAQRDRHLADYQAGLAERLSARPTELDARDVRPLVTACAMWREAKGLDMDSYARVCNYRLRFTSGEKTVREAVFDSGLGAIASTFLDRNQYDHNGVGLERVTQAITESTQQHSVALEGAVGDLKQTMGQVGISIVDAGMPQKRRGS